MQQTWSEAFAACLVAKGLNQLQATFALKVSSSKIHYWTHGTRPRDERVRRRIERWSDGTVPADLPARRAA